MSPTKPPDSMRPWVEPDGKTTVYMPDGTKVRAHPVDAREMIEFSGATLDPPEEGRRGKGSRRGHVSTTSGPGKPADADDLETA